METITVKLEFVECENNTELLACRVCLSTDVKLFNLFKYNLSDTFSNFVGAPVSQLDKLPQHVCSMCGTLLLKSEAFRAKCRKTHFILQDMMAWKPHQLTTEHFQTLNRTGFEIPLTETNTLKVDLFPDGDRYRTNQEIEYTNDLEGSQDTPYDLNLVKIDTEEPFPDDMSYEQTVHVHTQNVPSITKRDNSNKESKSKPQKAKKTKKDSVKKVERKRDKRKIKKTKPKKIKRPCNIKFEDDYKEFSEMYEVDVIYLNKEQQLKELNATKETSTYEKSRFKCTMCYRGFMSDSVYKKHMVWHDPNTGENECEICHLRYRCRRNWLLHIRRQHKVRFVCRRCGQRSKCSTSAKLHFKWHEGFKYTCRYCSKNFTLRKSCTNHEKDSHIEISCEECGETVVGLLALAVHKKTHEQPYKCSKCPLGFQNKDALEKHQCNYSSCPTCGENFWGKQLLNQHMLKEHNVGVVCNECGLVWKTEESLKDHWLRMHREKNPIDGESSHSEYVCEVCAKICKSAVLLRNHQLTHSGELPYACTLCEQRFRFKSSLQVHINAHTGARPYKCHFCPETFKSYGQRYKHKLLVHTKERKHKCSLCDKAYKLIFDLKTHMRTAHLKIPLPKRRRRGEQIINQ